MPPEVETLWLQVHLPHVKPMLIGCCYRPPSANSAYLDVICDLLEKGSKLNCEIYFMGDLNVD